MQHQAGHCLLNLILILCLQSNVGWVLLQGQKTRNLGSNHFFQKRKTKHYHYAWMPWCKVLCGQIVAVFGRDPKLLVWAQELQQLTKRWPTPIVLGALVEHTISPDPLRVAYYPTDWFGHTAGLRFSGTWEFPPTNSCSWACQISEG